MFYLFCARVCWYPRSQRDCHIQWNLNVCPWWNIQYWCWEASFVHFKQRQNACLQVKSWTYFCNESYYIQYINMSPLIERKFQNCYLNIIMISHPLSLVLCHCFSISLLPTCLFLSSFFSSSLCCYSLPSQLLYINWQKYKNTKI